MMNLKNISYFLLLVAQVLILVLINPGQYLMIVFLPAMVLCLGLRKRPAYIMLTAFLFGLFADFFCGGKLGLCTASLLPIAFLRGLILRLSFGSELYSHSEAFSIERQGVGKVFLATVLSTALFLAVYIALDSVGTRPFGVDALKFLLSLVVSTALSMYIIKILQGADTKWR